MKKILSLISITLLFFTVACSSEKTYSMNEKIYVTNSDGEYSIQIVDVEKTKSSDNKDIVIITYELENRSISSPIDKDEWNFMVYDKSGNMLKNYLMINQNNKSADIGEIIEMKIGYFYEKDNNYLKLKYFDDYSSSNVDAIFELEW